MPGIGVVLNPRSRRNLRDPRAADRLARRLGDVGVVRQANSIDELYRIAEDFRHADIDVLAISGGDGTNHVTLTGFLDVYAGHTMPQVALLRGGTMNTVANSVGVRHGRPEGLLGRLIRDYAQQASMPLENVERNVMRIAPTDGTRAHYGFLFGTGVVHGFLAEYYAGGDPTPLVAAKVLARGVGSAMIGGQTIRRMAKPFRGSVKLGDGTSWEERDYLAVAAGTIAHIGLNFKPFHRYDELPGRFHMLGIHTTPWSFVKDMPRIHRGEPMRPGKTFDAILKRAVVRSADGHMRYMIDGDLHEARGDIELAIGPKVKLVVVR
ncbi:MAG TPA: diacylglycerol kinase family protein [Polyangiaceae bacterium]|nr:diacylglycerol kinase family protein [Polyangiaceae bacterium]